MCGAGDLLVIKKEEILINNANWKIVHSNKQRSHIHSLAHDDNAAARGRCAPSRTAMTSCLSRVRARFPYTYTSPIIRCCCHCVVYTYDNILISFLFFPIDYFTERINRAPTTQRTIWRCVNRAGHVILMFVKQTCDVADNK